MVARCHSACQDGEWIARFEKILVIKRILPVDNRDLHRGRERGRGQERDRGRERAQIGEGTGNRACPRERHPVDTLSGKLDAPGERQPPWTPSHCLSMTLPIVCREVEPHFGHFLPPFDPLHW